jgi:hypothetical protein
LRSSFFKKFPFLGFGKNKKTRPKEKSLRRAVNQKKQTRGTTQIAFAIAKHLSTGKRIKFPKALTQLSRKGSNRLSVFFPSAPELQHKATVPGSHQPPVL